MSAKDRVNKYRARLRKKQGQRFEVYLHLSLVWLGDWNSRSIQQTEICAQAARLMKERKYEHRLPPNLGLISKRNG